MGAAQGGEPVLPDDRIIVGLGRLEARAWAYLLRLLRRLDDLPAAFEPFLLLPGSELATGPRRVQLSRLIAGEPEVQRALLQDPALPAAAHAVLGGRGTPKTQARSGSLDEDVRSDAASQGGATGDDDETRPTERLRELRRELAEVRRQRDGAEARAGVAETRVAEAEQVRSRLEGRIATLEAELARGGEEVEQATARAQRRSAGRIEELERALADERSKLDGLRRSSDRDRSALAAAQQELEQLRAREGTRSAVSVTQGEEVSRPLVLPDSIPPGTTEAARWLLDGVDVLLVDGYNVSLALHGRHRLDEQRRWLVDRLRPLVARGQTAPIVVFDGEGEGRAHRDPSGVEVRFTASGVIADDEIVFAVAATEGPVLVITDDAELQERVRVEGGNVLGTVHLLGAIDG